MRRVFAIPGSACWVLATAVLGGCASPGAQPRSAQPPGVSAAWERRDRGAEPAPVYRQRAVEIKQKTTPDTGDAIVRVNGRPISRNRLFDLLIQSRGAEVVEQLIAYESAMALAQEKGLSINDSDVAYERRLAAERVWNPLAPFTTEPLDDQAAQALLQSVLDSKNISPAEFDLVLRRNALLRKIVEHDEAFSEAQYEEEFQRAYGERVRVRHIQLATPAEVARIQEQLDAGVSFESLASKYSANQASARNGGLLEPFARNDDELPEIFRQTAFALKPGDVSGAVRAGAWYHLIRVESRIPPEPHKLEDVRDTLTERLRRRLGEAAMFRLYERLLREARIEFFDPALRDAYRERSKARGG